MKDIQSLGMSPMMTRKGTKASPRHDYYHSASILSRGSGQTGISTRLGLHLRVLRLALSIRFGCFTRRERLLKVVDDVVDMFGTYRYPNEIFRHPRILFFLVAELLMRGGPGMDGQGFRVPDTK